MLSAFSSVLRPVSVSSFGMRGVFASVLILCRKEHIV